MNFYDNFEKYADCAPVGVLLPEIEIEKKWYKYLDIPETSTNLEFIKAFCNKKFLEKKLGEKPNKKEYIDRCRYEINILDSLGFIDYILLNWDILNWCAEKEIPVGAGRGSAAGSLVLYLLGVTKVDPIEYGLFFERFVSKSRAKKIEHNGTTYLDGSLLADVDNDIALDRRQEVINYIKDKHSERSCRIINLMTLGGKICVKEVGKIIGEYTEQEMNDVSSLIPSHFGKTCKFAEAIEENEHFAAWAKENPDIQEITQKIEGLIKNAGVHASGIAISRQKLTDICPIQKTKDGELVSCYDMDWVAEIMVKFDILGLKTLAALYDACKATGVVLDEIDVTNPELYKEFQSLDNPQGLFQIEADTNLQVCQQIKPRNLDDVSAVVAIARPGALQFRDPYATYVETGKFQSQHEFFDDVLSYTGGMALYQEQLMKMAVKIGFTLDEAEQLRRIVGKKKVDQMPAWQEKIAAKIEENNLDPKLGEILWKIAEDSANYSFNRSHSICYSVLSMWTLHMKTYYPLEFFTALLRNSKFEQDPFERISKVSKELGNYGIELLRPDLVKSQMDFAIEGKNIRYGLNSVKGVSEKSLQAIIDFRDKEASNKFDIFVAAKQAKINIGVLSGLIQAGALNSAHDDRAYMVYEAQVFNVFTDREKRNFLNLGPQYNFDLFKIWKDEVIDGNNIADDGKPFVKESRRETIKTKASKYREIYVKNSKNVDFANWFFEKKLLGYSYSGRLKDIYEKSDLRTGIEEIKNEISGVTFYTIGIITSVTYARTRAKNEKYCRFNLSDEKGDVTCFVWNELLTKLEEDDIKLGKENIVSVKGRTGNRGGLNINNLKVLDDKIFMKLSDLK